MKPLCCALLLLLGTSLGCVSSEEETHSPESLRSHKQAIRPTEEMPYLGIGYEGVMANSFDTEDGNFRVWWATSGVHAPPLEDVMPANGTPDYVELVGTTAERVALHLEMDSWRLAIDDTEAGVNGGDGRFDIYLVNFGGRSDGLVARNRCFVQGPVQQCAVHMLIENDFVGYNYPSVAQAIDVLVSHEYFHAVQSAYNGEYENWILEGSATWFQENFNPLQSDFERLAGRYPRESSRGLTSPSQGPTDGFNYHTALFFHYLDTNYNDTLIRKVFEQTARNTPLLTALDDELKASHSSSLVEAFQGFALWNAFTGSRTIDGQGYAAARQFSDAPVLQFDGQAGLNWNVEVDAFAAKYAQITVSSPMTVAIRPVEGIDQQPSVLVMTSPSQSLTVTPGSPAQIENPGSKIFLAAVNTNPEGRTAGQVALRRYTPPKPMADMGTPAEDMSMGQVDMNTLEVDMTPSVTDDMDLVQDMNTAQKPDMNLGSFEPVSPTPQDSTQDEGCSHAQNQPPSALFGMFLMLLSLLGWRGLSTRVFDKG